MNLNGIKVLIAAQYAAPYEGNFIASLKALQKNLLSEHKSICGFVFPKAMKNQPWADKFIEENKVYLTGSTSSLKSSDDANKIVEDFNPDLIYTHFEGYDIRFLNAARRYSSNNRKIRVIWHMHDTLGFVANPIKALYQRYYYFKRYGLPFIRPLWGG